MMYQICVSSRWIQRFGSLKPLFFKTGSQSGWIWKWHPCIFVCTANPCILWNDDVITPTSRPYSDTATSRNSTNNNRGPFVLQKLLSLLAKASFVVLDLYTARKVYANAQVLFSIFISVAELQRHILVWHVYYIVLSQFQWFRVYLDFSWDNAVFTEKRLDSESSGFMWMIPKTFFYHSLDKKTIGFWIIAENNVWALKSHLDSC